jgi:tRNA A37 threonylcarbamoyladenosine modification protein TsaB
VEVAIALNLRARSNNTQEKDNNSPKAIDNLSLKLKQKKQEVQQLEINPNDILEEEEKRQPLCQQE